MASPPKLALPRLWKSSRITKMVPTFRAAVSSGAPTKHLVKAAEKPAERAVEEAGQPIRSRMLRLQQNRAERGTQCQRIESRDQRRNRNRQSKLPIKLSGDAADECSGN